MLNLTQRFSWSKIFLSSFSFLLAIFFLLLIATPTALASLNDDKFDGNIFALYAGYKNHKSSSFIPYGILGLIILITALFLGEEVLGELGEQLLTLLGASIVAFAHYKNYRLCRALECDSCHD